MTLDPQAAPILEFLRRSGPLHRLGVAGARAWAASRPPARWPDVQVGAVANHRVDHGGRSVPVRLYQPVHGEPVHSERPVPVVVYLHAGGWIMGDLDGADGVCRRLAATSGCLVASVGYALAPEHPYPQAIQEVTATLEWLRRDAAVLGVDADRICVAGESSGGNLAAAACLAIRDQSGRPPVLQLLVCPVIDPARDSGSWRELGGRFPPDPDQMAWMWELYAAGRGSAPYLAPGRSTDLAGLPPALVLTAEFDPLRDEAEQYADRLAAAGVPVLMRRIPGQLHAIFSYAHSVDTCREALDAAARWTGDRLAEASAPGATTAS